MILFNLFKIWLLSLFIGQTSGISYNQPKLCANATWNQNATTFATSTLVGTQPLGIFVDTNNTVYVADRADNRIVIWLNGSTTPTRNISGGLNGPYPLFVTDNGDVYVDNSYANYRVDKWAWNTTSSVPAMYTCSQCYGIFVDIYNMLYCSMYSYHQVIYKSLTQNLNVWSNVAGISNTAGSTSTTLNGPVGIFVDNYLNLYVADYANSRIQKFASGQLNGTTISTGAITLSYPTSIILDSGGFIFITDNHNHRIIGSGPNGFRCIAACSGQGSSSSQLNYPQSISFDSYGNIFVVDQDNSRIQKFLLLSNFCNTTTATTMMNLIQTTTASTSVSYSNVISFNQPKFGAYATWDSVGITFTNSSTVGSSPYGIFVDTNNTVYVANTANNQIQVWLSGSSIPTRNITSGVTSPYSIFATITGDIYVDNGYANNRVDKWASYGNISSSVMQVQGACYDLFIDVNNTLYCSLYTQHQVAIKSLNGNSSMWTVAAGTECSGSTSNSLYNPRGIFVDTNLNLYVADCGNNRVQLFLSGQVTATTVAGSTATGTISLSCPSDVALDSDGYLFIVDSNNSRIIGSGPNGFRCIIACGSTSGSTSSQLSNPSTFSFDSYGNIYVTDRNNSRQYRPPPPVLLRAAAVPQVVVVLLLVLQQVVAVPQVVLLRAAVVPPQVALLPPPPPPPPAVLLQAAALPQVALLPRPPPAVLLRAAVVPQLALLPQLVLQQVVAVLQVALPRVAAVRQVALLRAAAVLQVALLPRPPPAVLPRAAVVPPQVALLPRPPPPAVLQRYRPPPPVLLRAAALPQVVLPRAAVVPPQVALLPQLLPPVLLRAAAVLQVALLPQQVVAVLRVALLPRPPAPVPVPQVALLRPPVLQQVVAVLQVALLPQLLPPVLLRAAVVPQLALLRQVVLQQVVAVLRVALLPRPPAPVLLRAAALPQVVLPRAAVVPPQVALLPRPPPPVLLPLVLQQVVPVLQVALPRVAAVLQGALLPRPSLAVSLRAAVAVPQVALLLPLLLLQVAVVPQVVLL
ncbi:unnamed protein product [Adineta steineri]|uniref:NHL repeat containing protein n=2 Tax=Adineta steineri TaxID=433720 RepID=A0A815AEF1_9BILA|nr:unnamed protein product [Adineta steineri]